MQSDRKLDPYYQALIDELVESPKYRYRRPETLAERRKRLTRRAMFGAVVGIAVGAGLNWLARILR